MNGMMTFCAASLAILTVGTAKAEWDFRRGVQRTMRTISTATEKRHPVVRLAFYGDASVAYGWTRDLHEDFKKRFPNVNFQIQKKAVEKATADTLVERVDKDILEIYPDVVFFHAGGSMAAYEAVVRKIRLLTTAEIVLFSRSSMSADDVKGRRAVAEKYHCLFVESADVNVRAFGDAFVSLPDAPDESAFVGTVKVEKPADVFFQFSGNRVDVHQSGKAMGPVSVLLDGAKPSSTGAVVATDLLERHVPGWRSTLLKGIPNGRHVLSLMPTTGKVDLRRDDLVALVGVIDFTVYAPPLPEAFGTPLFAPAAASAQ